MSAEKAHSEAPVQEHLVQQLVALQGYKRRDPKEHYDRALALDRDMTLGFIKASQPQVWEKLVQHYAESAELSFFNQLAQSLKAWHLERIAARNQDCPGHSIFPLPFPPRQWVGTQRMDEYEANILSVMDEVEYSQKNGALLNYLTLS